MNYRSPWLIKAGQLFFKRRGETPIPYWAAVLFFSFIVEPNPNHYLYSLIGIALVVLGETIRMICVKRARSITRTRSSNTGNRLIREGIYRFSRNPIYIGNFFIGLGITIVSCVLWAIPIYIVVFWMQYIPIVAYEESILAGKFGQEYRNYQKTVPRWIGITKLPPASKDESLDIYGMNKVLKSEQSTLFATAALLIIMQLHNWM